MDVLLDSNIVIYAVEPSAEKLREWVGMHSLFISRITELEVLGYHKINPTDEKALTNVLNTGYFIDVDTNVINQAIILRQQKSMSLGDSIVAATALIEQIHLATANTKDFAHIENLNIINPLEL